MWPTSPSPISATASSPISASRCSPSSARADLSWIQTVHSGRLLSGFLNDANLLIRQTASRSHRHARRELSQGHHPRRHHVLHGCALRLADPAVHADRLVRARRASAARCGNRPRKSLQETGDLSALITQTLRGMRIVRAYRQEHREEARAATTINRALEFTMRGTRARALSSPSVELLTGFGFALPSISPAPRGSAAISRLAISWAS